MTDEILYNIEIEENQIFDKVERFLHIQIEENQIFDKVERLFHIELEESQNIIAFAQIIRKK